MRNTLQTRIHEASIPKIPESHHSFQGILIVLELKFLFIRLSVGRASVGVVGAVAKLAVFGAIGHKFTTAEIVEFLDIPAVSAGGGHQVLLIEEAPVVFGLLKLHHK